MLGSMFRCSSLSGEKAAGKGSISLPACFRGVVGVSLVGCGLVSFLCDSVVNFEAAYFVEDVVGHTKTAADQIDCLKLV